MIAILTRLCRWITAVNRTVMIAATVLIAPMVVVICYEVVVRYAFDAPTVWAMELARLLLGPYFLLIGPYLLHLGGHVNVDIVYAKLSERWARIVDLLTIPVILYFAATLLYFSLPLALDSIARGETSTSAWNPYIWPAKATMPLAFVLLIAQALAEWGRAWCRVTGHPDPVPPPAPEHTNDPAHATPAGENRNGL